MANWMPTAIQPSSLVDLADYQRDAEQCLRLYFTKRNPDYVKLFAGELPSSVQAKLNSRILETDLRSALAIMASLEAQFRLDHRWRLKAKRPDAVSITFRRSRRKNVRLDEDILETWRANHPGTRPLIGELRGAFKFRHWLAHGRYWPAGRKYDFQTLYLLADGVRQTFPLFI
jgi:hypothetical protein